MGGGLCLKIVKNLLHVHLALSLASVLGRFFSNWSYFPGGRLAKYSISCWLISIWRIHSIHCELHALFSSYALDETECFMKYTGTKHEGDRELPCIYCMKHENFSCYMCFISRRSLTYRVIIITCKLLLHGNCKSEKKNCEAALLRWHIFTGSLSPAKWAEQWKRKHYSNCSSCVITLSHGFIIAISNYLRVQFLRFYSHSQK